MSSNMRWTKHGIMLGSINYLHQGNIQIQNIVLITSYLNIIAYAATHIASLLSDTATMKNVVLVR